ncbi:MAG: hypothetical protein IKG18_18600 [Atopobiaceae bacterium]|nr:hypothetical protein [Atopobiaceae bacterium]
MIDEKRWQELIQEEDEAFFKGDLVLSLPEGSYSAEEMWDIVMDMFKTSIAVEQEMRRDFESHTPLEQIHLFDALVATGVRSWDWWFNVLLADEEPELEGLFQ